MKHVIKKGWGFDVDVNFARATGDLPIELAPGEPTKPGYVAGYIAGNPGHALTFLRPDRILVHVQARAVQEIGG